MSFGADKANEAQARWNAYIAKKEGSSIAENTALGAKDALQEMEKALGQHISVLAKTGNLGTRVNNPSAGVAGTGYQDVLARVENKVDQEDRQSSTEKEYMDKIAGLQEDLEKVKREGSGRWVAQADSEGWEDTTRQDIKRLEKDIAEYEGYLAEGRKAEEGVGQVKGSEALGLTAGSDLVSLASTRAIMNRELNRYIRQGKEESILAFSAGRHYDRMAGYARMQGQWNTATTILGGVMGAANFGLGMGWFGPKG